MTIVGVGVGVLLLSTLTYQLVSAEVFCDNLKVTRTSLTMNITTSPVHFATASFGKAPDVAYALALCKGVVLNGSACGECVADWFDKMISEKPPPPQQCFKINYYYGYCIIVYSNNDDILAPYNNTAESTLRFRREWWNERNATGDIGVIAGLIRDLLVGTVEKAASMAPGRFATGVMDTNTTFPSVYSLAQCMPDMSSSDCLACLRHLLGTVNSTMYMRMGGQVYFIRCFFRYEATHFYDGEPMLHLGTQLAPTPAPTKPPNHKSKLVP